MGQKVTITLNIEADNLYKIKSPTQADIDNNTSITDDNSGLSLDGRHENFISNVFIDNDVRWVGVTNDLGYFITIQSVIYEPTNKGSSINFFTLPILLGTGKKSGHVESTVKNDGNLVGKQYCYSINFKIYRMLGCLSLFLWRGSAGPFTIDPKLSGKPNT